MFFSKISCFEKWVNNVENWKKEKEKEKKDKKVNL